MSAGFADAARYYRRYGAVAVPVRPDESRTPCMKWQTLKRPLADATIDKLAARFPDAATALVCKPSRLTVVDVDIAGAANDDRVIGMMVAKFGDTPLIVESPKAGLHLYYKSNGEPNADLRTGPLALDGDLRGVGGVITAPPSIRGYGPYLGMPYRFLRGDHTDLRHLPQVKPGPLNYLRSTIPTTNAGMLPGPPETSERLDGIYPEDRLFHHLQKFMHRVDLDGLIDVGHEFVSAGGLDLPLAKIKSTAERVHKFARENPDWRGGAGQTRLPNDILLELINHSDALALLFKLVLTFRGRHQTFPISAKAMARAGTIPSWGKSPDRYRAATRALLSIPGVLEIVQAGGRGLGDPRLYRFGSRIPDTSGS